MKIELNRTSGAKIEDWESGALYRKNTNEYVYVYFGSRADNHGRNGMYRIGGHHIIEYPQWAEFTKLQTDDVIKVVK